MKTVNRHLYGVTLFWETRDERDLEVAVEATVNVYLPKGTSASAAIAEAARLLRVDPGDVASAKVEPNGRFQVDTQEPT